MDHKRRKARIPAEHAELIEQLTEEGEEWMPHPVHTQFYGSSLGRVISVAENNEYARLLRVGGDRVELWRGTRRRDGRPSKFWRKQYLPHRFIWECFYGEADPYMQIVFRDGDRSNRKLENLDLVTPAVRCRMN